MWSMQCELHDDDDSVEVEDEADNDARTAHRIEAVACIRTGRNDTLHTLTNAHPHHTVKLAYKIQIDDNCHRGMGEIACVESGAVSAVSALSDSWNAVDCCTMLWKAGE